MASARSARVQAARSAAWAASTMARLVELTVQLLDAPLQVLDPPVGLGHLALGVRLRPPGFLCCGELLLGVTDGGRQVLGELVDPLGLLGAGRVVGLLPSGGPDRLQWRRQIRHRRCLATRGDIPQECGRGIG